jgi:hypothetical protein
MTTKEILEKLKLTFAELVAPAPETAPEMVQPIKVKTKDGVELEVSEMGVGGTVTIQGQPAPVGEHTLEDGTVLTVGDNGVITAIVPAEPMVEDMTKQMQNKFNAFEAATNEKFSAYEQKFADYEARLGKATKVIEGLLSLTQTLAEQPTGTPDPVVTGKNNFVKTEKVEKNYSLLFS